jgi:hypothetical protein
MLRATPASSVLSITPRMSYALKIVFERATMFYLEESGAAMPARSVQSNSTESGQRQ